jgi:hypothetical protein
MSPASFAIGSGTLSLSSGLVRSDRVTCRVFVAKASPENVYTDLGVSADGACLLVRTTTLSLSTAYVILPLMKVRPDGHVSLSSTLSLGAAEEILTFFANI